MTLLSSDSLKNALCFHQKQNQSQRHLHQQHQHPCQALLSQLNLQTVRRILYELSLKNEFIYLYIYIIYIYASYSNFLGTIRCDFDADWCGFVIKNSGDSASQQGFKWNRRTSANIKNNNIEGPEQGKKSENI